MIRRIVTTFALAACTIVPMSSNAVSLFGRSGGVSAASDMPKGKTVKLTLKNRTAAVMTVVVNDKPVTIAANGELCAEDDGGNGCV